MRDRRATEPRHGLDLMCPGDEVDRDRVLVAGHREGRRLAGRLDERDEVWPGDLANVEPREDGVREVDEADPEVVPPGRGVAFHETGGGERAELPRYRARRHAGAARDLVRAELASVCKGVEHGDRSLGSANSAGRRLTCARHRCRFVADSGTALLKVQFTL
jgi:hypothetical protein